MQVPLGVSSSRFNVLVRAPFGDSGFSYVLSKRPRRLKFGNSERDGEDQASGRTADRDVLHVRAKGCRQGIGTAVKRLQARLRRGSTGRSCPAITSRHRPKPAGNASTCGTGVPITISMAHSTKRTAREVVAAAAMTRIRHEQVANGEAQTSTPEEPQAKASVGVERSAEGLAQATSK